MTEDSKRFAWVNIWMMVFAVVGIWLVWPHHRTFVDPSRGFNWYGALQVIIPLGIVFLVGFFRMPISLYYEAGRSQRPTMDDVARLYLDALKTVFRQKWILWLFGAMLALTVLAGCINTWLEYIRFRQFSDFTTSGWSPGFPGSVEEWLLVLPKQLSSAVNMAMGRFLPSSGLGEHGIAALLLPVILLALVIWLSRRLRSLPDEPQYVLMRKALFPVTLVSIVFIAFPLTELIMSIPRAGAEFGPSTAYLVTSMVASGLGIVLRTLFSGAFVAGLGGSLLRMKRGEPVNIESFQQDVVRYLVPVAGVYLLLAALYLLFFLGEGIPGMVVLTRSNFRAGWPNTVGRIIQDLLDIVKILAMFAPFAVIVRDTGAWQEIKESSRQWFARSGDVISFVALGLSFMGAVLTVGNLSWGLAASGYPRVFPPMPVEWLRVAIDSAFKVFVSAVMAVAVWEFYWRITRSSEQA